MDIYKIVQISGLELEQVFPGGLWDLGFLPTKRHSHVVFSGRVTHRSIGVAIQEDAQLILSIEHMGEVRTNSELYEPLFKHGIRVYSLGKEWTESKLARNFLARILGMEDRLTHSNGHGVRFATSHGTSLPAILSRIGRGGCFWFSDPSEFEQVVIHSVGMGRMDADIVLSTTLQQDLLDSALKLRKHFGWIQWKTVLNELSRELMRHLSTVYRVKTSLVIEKSKRALTIE